MENKDIPKINSRFLSILKQKNYSGYKLSKEVKEISEAKIAHIRSGRNIPSTELISALITKFPDINANWLLNEQGEMLIKENNITSSQEKNTSLDLNTVQYVVDNFEEAIKQHSTLSKLIELEVNKGIKKTLIDIFSKRGMLEEYEKIKEKTSE